MTILRDREKDYGKYKDNVHAIADIMATLNDIHISKNKRGLSEEDRAKLHYIVIKLVRLGASPEHYDSWLDLEGYAKLNKETLTF